VTLRDMMKKVRNAAHKRKWTTRLWVLVVMPIAFAVAIPLAIVYALKEAGEAFVRHESWYDLWDMTIASAVTVKTGKPMEFRR
jgi:ABC-type sugar transport system permease subunit